MMKREPLNAETKPLVADGALRLAGQLLVSLDWLSENAWRWVLGPTAWLLLAGAIQLLGTGLHWPAWALWIGHGLAFLVGIAVMIWAVRVRFIDVDDEAMTGTSNQVSNRKAGGQQ